MVAEDPDYRSGGVTPLTDCVPASSSLSASLPAPLDDTIKRRAVRRPLSFLLEDGFTEMFTHVPLIRKPGSSRYGPDVLRACP